MRTLKSGLKAEEKKRIMDKERMTSAIQRFERRIGYLETGREQP